MSDCSRCEGLCLFIYFSLKAGLNRNSFCKSVFPSVVFEKSVVLQAGGWSLALVHLYLEYPGIQSSVQLKLWITAMHTMQWHEGSTKRLVSTVSSCRRFLISVLKKIKEEIREIMWIVFKGNNPTSFESSNQTLQYVQAHRTVIAISTLYNNRYNFQTIQTDPVSTFHS